MNNSDYGPLPFTVDLTKATLNNNNFRTALWTGEHLQLTLMTVPVDESIGLEVHHDVDQFLFIMDGSATAQMGDREDNLVLQYPVFLGHAVFVPAGVWHNLTNTGNRPLKLFTIYAPPEHAHGTVHRTKAIAEAEEHHRH